MFKMHAGARAEPILAAWGITAGGAPVCVALAAGGSESTDAWLDFLDELATRQRVSLAVAGYQALPVLDLERIDLSSAVAAVSRDRIR
jgi:transposase-like protein